MNITLVVMMLTRVESSILKRVTPKDALPLGELSN